MPVSPQYGTLYHLLSTVPNVVATLPPKYLEGFCWGMYIFWHIFTHFCQFLTMLNFPKVFCPECRMSSTLHVSNVACTKVAVLNVVCPQCLVLNVAVLNVFCPQCPIGDLNDARIDTKTCCSGYRNTFSYWVKIISSFNRIQLVEPRSFQLAIWRIIIWILRAPKVKLPSLPKRQILIQEAFARIENKKFTFGGNLEIANQQNL